jgi:Tol biopolymer transport system component
LSFLTASPPSLRLTDARALSHDGVAKGGQIFTDGARLFYYAVRTGNLARLDEGATRGVPVTGLLEAFVIQDFSVARSEFLALKRGVWGEPWELWAVPTGEETPRRLGNRLCKAAAWASHGRRIACGLDGALSIFRADGSDVSSVSLGGAVEYLHWSPDGSTLRFTVTVRADRSVRSSLWEAKADGQSPRPLLPGWNDGGECCGRWMPDGRHYVFEAERDGRKDLWALPESFGLLGARDEAPIRLTTGPLNFSTALPSVDGRRLYAYGATNHGELVRYDSTLQQFVPYLGGVSAFGVSFSPDRRSVAYISFPENNLWVARADGSGPRQLTFPPLEVTGLAWSPDGSQLALRAGIPKMHQKIHIIPAAGGTPEPLVADDVEQGMPSWSRDGRQLVFGDVPPVFGQPDGTEVLHRLDVATKTMSTVPGSRGLWTSRWSPDGRYISALTIEQSRRQSLQLFDVEKQEWRSTDADHVNAPTWSRDSKYIYYDTEGARRVLRRVRVSDGSVEQIADISTYPLAHYGWSGLSLDGSPLVLGNKYDVEIYAFDVDRR